MRALLFLLAFASLACALSLVDTITFVWVSQSDLIAKMQSGEYSVVDFTDGHPVSQSESLNLAQRIVPIGPATAFSGSYCKPVNAGIGSPFGACRDGCSRPHQGVDLFASRGTPVKAAASGTAYYHLSNPTGYGTAVYINHGPITQTRYAHLNSISIQDGQEVSQGQVIGTVGNTGNARGTSPHLHFEIRVNGDAKDPAPLISGKIC